MAEVGQPGQVVDVLAGDDVDGSTGRLLTVAELQQALRLAHRLAAVAEGAGRPTASPATELPVEATPWEPRSVLDLFDTPADDPAEPDMERNVEDVARGRRSWWDLHRAPRALTPTPATPVSSHAPPGPINGPRIAPQGFTGPAAARAWSWLTGVDSPRVVVCAASGGIGVSTVTAALAQLTAAARPDPVLALEVNRWERSKLTRQVCGDLDQVSGAQWWEQLERGEPMWAGVPTGPSGARVLQAAPRWWRRITDTMPPAVAVLTDLGSLEHADARSILLEHRGPVVVVTRADPTGVSDALAAVTELRGHGLTGRAVLAVTDSSGSRPGTRRTAERLARTAGPAVVVSHARLLRRAPLPASGWDRRTAECFAELVCAIAGSARLSDRTGSAPTSAQPADPGLSLDRLPPST